MIYRPKGCFLFKSFLLADFFYKKVTKIVNVLLLNVDMSYVMDTYVKIYHFGLETLLRSHREMCTMTA